MYNMGARADALAISNGISKCNLPLENIKVMLEEGRAKGNLKGSRALQRAAQLNRVETVRVLLDAGADIDEITDSGDFRVRGPYQALWNAAREGHVDMVKLLLSRGSRPDLDNGKFHSLPNGTALNIARKQGHTEIVALLEEALRASAKE